MTITVNILLFATLKELAGESKFPLSILQNEPILSDVRAILLQHYPEMGPGLKTAIASVNREYAFDTEPISDGDEIAFFPPVSGGDINDRPEIFLLPTEPIDHDEIIKAITTASTGAVCLFSGMVRRQTHQEGHLQETLHLEYEAYAPMALGKMRQVAAEIRTRWPLVEGIVIVQRLGKLEVGQNTVIIACSSPHRDDGCFEAARYGIDRLKEVVPVWKKEIGVDGETWIEGGYTPQPSDRHP